ELALLDLLEENLRAETRYIDINSIESAAEELQKKPRPDVYFEEQQTVKDSFEESGQVKALVPDEWYREKTIPYVERGDYYIQVASFNKKANAESFAKSLRKKMYKVIVEEALVEEKTFFRVRVGPFETKGIATNTMAAMKNRYSIKDPFVLKKNS
ncbi:MAG: SPOR domain-containing protein, partial [Spirochaetes bacterium]|nr:SPOR domain-containing protein [Spirochaetota bacterium]